MPLTAGTRLGAFEILAPLGAGGMGEVYKARDTRLDRIVAIKVLSGVLAADPQLRERFEREARAISSLSHSNICVLHDIGRERPRPASPSNASTAGRPTGDEEPPLDFLVMELLDGETLAARLARGPVKTTRLASLAAVERTSPQASRVSTPTPGTADTSGVSAAGAPSGPPMSVTEALQIAVQITDALDAAHRQGIVHRDLKPANVMLLPAGSGTPRVKLLDFGLARLIGAGTRETQEGGGLVNLADLAAPTMSTPLTVKGTILGTLQYMAPEQVEGRDVDARTDLFALGGILYEMLTGRRPFVGRSQASLIGAILDHDPPPVRTAQPLAHPLLDETVARCLAKNPDDRWQTARDLKRQLAWLATQGAESAPGVVDRSTGAAQPDARRRLLRSTALVVAGAILAGAGVAWALWPTTPPPPVVTRFAIDLLDGQTFTRAGRHLFALSPDGTRLVYVASNRLFMRRMGELAATPIPGTEGTDPSEPVFSPTGDAIAFWSDEQLKKIPADGGPPRTICKAANPLGMSWSGDRILFGQREPRGIFEVAASGGTPKPLLRLDAGTRGQPHGPQLIAGGRALLFTLRTSGTLDGWNEAAIVVHTLATGEQSEIVRGGTDARLLPTGHLAYARDGVLFAVPFDEERLALRGEPVAVVEGVRQLLGGGASGAAQMAWSASGSMVFLPGEAGVSAGRKLVWMDRTGKETPLAAQERNYVAGGSAMRIAPDGTRIALLVESTAAPARTASPPAETGAEETSQTGNDVWVFDLARGTLTRLTFTANAGSTGWTPDSQRICHTALQEVLCQAADGSGGITPLVKADRLASLRGFSPDAKYLVFAIGPQKGNWDIGLATLGPPAVARPLVHTEAGEFAPAISPDGRWVAYATGVIGRPEVYVRPFPEVDRGRWQASADGGSEPRWAHDSRTLYYSAGGGGRGRRLLAVSVSPGPTFVATPPSRVVAFPRSAVGAYDVAPDGRFLFMVRATALVPAIEASRMIVVQHWFDELRARVPIK